MQLGNINFSALARLLWKSADHFLPMQTFYLNYISTMYKAVHSPGVISGCEVSLVSGLTVEIATGTVLFDNGELVNILSPIQQTMAAADPTNPRIDRVNLIHSTDDGSSVTLTTGGSAVFDKLQNGSGAVQTGTPAGSPSAPVKTAGAISVALVNVAATQTVLAAEDLDQSEVARDISRHLLDGTPREFAISNSQGTLGDGNTAVPVTLLRADKTKHRALFVDYHLRRKTDTLERVISGVLALHYKTTGDVWELSDNSYGDDDAEVEFYVDETTGQVEYVSSTLAGGNHVGTLAYTTRKIDI